MAMPHLLRAARGTADNQVRPRAFLSGVCLEASQWRAVGEVSAVFRQNAQVFFTLGMLELRVEFMTED